MRQLAKSFLSKFTGRQTSPAEPISVAAEVPARPTFEWPPDIKPFEAMSDAVIRVFKADTDRITIIIPGYGSSGRKAKYEDVISAIMRDGNSAVISTNNPDSLGDSKEEYARAIIGQIMAIVEYAIQNAADITGSETTKITLYGSSAGGGAAAIAAGYFPQVDSVILTGPSRDVTYPLREELASMVKPFTGGVFLIGSAADPICNREAVEEYAKILSAATKFDITVIPGHDHAFESPQNHLKLLGFVTECFNTLKYVES